MCGISGIAGFSNISNKLFLSIKSLEYRGYDSCGIAIIDDDSSITIKKNIGTVEEVNEKENIANTPGKVGIAHSRWATHGKVTSKNTHPHKSCDGKFAIVHNGIISNYSFLKKNLKEKGHTFLSETDTEVIVHLIEEYYSYFNDIERALIKTIHDLEGTFAFALVSPYEKDKIFCAKNESPLILGISDECKFIGSDVNAFIEFTKNAIILDDGEYAIITKDSYIIKNYNTGEIEEKKITKIEWDFEMAKKGGYPHYMLKEIYEQPQTILSALQIDEDKISRMAQTIYESDLTFITGVGTTYYVSLFGEYLFSKIAGTYLPTISADEFRNLAEVNSKSAVLALSQSGETYDTIHALKYAKKNGAETMAIVNVIGSTISRIADKVIMQGSGPEICVISTKAAIAQMIMLNRIAIDLGLLKGKITKEDKKQFVADLFSLPDIIQSLLNERSGFIHSIARKYANKSNWLYLGRGIYYPVALESSLKMKEVAYVHAEAMPCGFLKHGTIAMIDENLYSIVFIPHYDDKEIYSLTMGSIEEISARNGFILGIHFGDKKNDLASLLNEEIVLPEVSPLVAPYLQLITAQLFSYFTATTLKRNIDKPRSLAKSVTVA